MFCAEIVALDLQLDAARELALSRKHAMRYELLSTIPSAVAMIAMSAKM